MMTLPKFDNPNITTKELLTETKLLDIFKHYGEISFNGSYVSELMVYPDLDLGVIATEVTKQDFGKLIGELVNSSHVRKISTTDTVNFPPVHVGRPKGYWLGLEIPFENDRWGIDLWLQTPEWSALDNANEYTERLSHLSERQVAAVLNIKYHLIRLGLYDISKFRSVQVYDAVLDNGVLSYEDFMKLHPVDR